MLVWASFSAASRKFSIDHDSGKASDSILLRTARDLFLMHVVDLDFMIGARLANTFAAGCMHGQPSEDEFCSRANP